MVFVPGGAGCRRLLATGLACAALGTSSAADAQSEACQPRDGFSTCFASDNLWPYAGDSTWVAQAPTQTTGAQTGAFGFHLSYLYRPVGLRVASADPDGTTIYAVEHVLGAAVLAAMGVTDRLQVQLEAPMVLFQDGASKADVVGSDEFLPRSAVGDFRFGTLFSVVPRARDADGFGLAARVEMAVPTGNDDAFAGAPSATYAPGVSGDYRLGRFSVGADLGARLREETSFAGTVIGSEITGALGLGVDALEHGWLRFDAEAFANFGLVRGVTEELEPGDDEPTEIPRPLHIPAEWLVTVSTRGALDGRFRARIGAGSFIPTGDTVPVTTPAFRTVFGVAYVHE
jgi:OOP family OmpA-OmpF porin